MVNLQLICAFVYTYAKSKFSHEGLKCILNWNVHKTVKYAKKIKNLFELFSDKLETCMKLVKVT